MAGEHSDVAVPPRNDERRFVVAGTAAAAAVIGALVGVVAVLAPDDDPGRREIVAERGGMVMPFDLERTTHVFDADTTGGVQTVVADDPTDIEQVELIRAHLREEADRFGAGDFGDPAAVHGHDMPGLETLEARFEALEVTYDLIDAGGQVIYRSEDPTVVAALHDWFDAQLSDHGAHADSG